MALTRTQRVALALVGLLAALVVAIALRNPQPPLLPRDDTHAGPVGECLDCHGADAPLPRSDDHPLGQDCRRCHGSR